LQGAVKIQRDDFNTSMLKFFVYTINATVVDNINAKYLKLSAAVIAPV